MINLAKGQTISLTKEVPGLSDIRVGLGWDEVKGLFKLFDEDIDVDASVICYANSKVDNTIYFGRKKGYNNAIVHHGDNLTGFGSGDDEKIDIHLNKLPKEITKISVIINIYEARERHQDFSKIKNCFVRIVDINKKKEIVRYNIDGNHKGKTGMFVADFFRESDNNWSFTAVGESVVANSINEMVKMR